MENEKMWSDNLDENSAAYRLSADNSSVIRAIAGPGSGKSFAIQRRVTRALEEGIDAGKILAVTFTRTAANDLRGDIQRLGAEGASDVSARTVHSHALSILMRANVIEGTGRVPRMILEHEIKPAFYDLDDERFGNLRSKERLCSEYLADWAIDQSDDTGTGDPVKADFRDALVCWMVDHKGMLVGEVVPIALEYLRMNPAATDIGKFDLVLIDEYQDLNKSEQEFLKCICGSGSKVVIVGDDDQSVYSFKYAHPEGIRELESMYGEYYDVPFDTCRRCPKRIVRCASDLIHNNSDRTLGKLVPFEENNEGEFNIIQWRTFDQEISGICELVEKIITVEDLEPQDVLILSPRRISGYKIRDRLIEKGIPVKSYFRESIFQSDVVKYAYSLLSWIADPEDEISLRFLIGYGGSKYRTTQYKKIREYANDNNLSIIDVLNRLVEETISIVHTSTIKKEYMKVCETRDDVQECLRNNPAAVFDDIFIDSEDDQIFFYEIKRIFEELLDEVETEEFSDLSSWFPDLFIKLQGGLINPEIPQDVDHVRVMSLHASKGLSAKVVIMVSMINELIPFVKDTMTDSEKVRAIEEQRRLFYVGMTRCKDGELPGKLYISSFVKIQSSEAFKMNIPSTPGGYRKTRSSRFIGELGPNAPTPVLGENLL